MNRHGVAFVRLSILLCVLLAPQAFARTCKVEIASNDQMQFDRTEIRIAGDCSKVELTLRHTGGMPAEVMGHNWVLAKTSDYQQVAADGGRATAADSFLAKGDARVIAHTALIGGGGSDTITFATGKLEKGGDYTFFCSFPGHWAIMNGKFVFG